MLMKYGRKQKNFLFLIMTIDFIDLIFHEKKMLPKIRRFS